MSDAIDRRPSRVGGGVAVAATAAVVLVLGAVDLLAGLLAAIGLTCFVAAVAGGYRRFVDAGAAGLLAAVAMGGVGGVSVPSLLVAAVLAVVAWDALDHGFGLSAHVGRGATTLRNETFHAGVSLVGGIAVAGVTYGVYVVVPSGWPLTALIMVMIAAMFALLALE